MKALLARLGPATALFGLALALRCYGLTSPLLDYHSWRQADTAAIARNFATGGYRLLYPQVDWGGHSPGYIESEFPLYSYTLALLYGIFGIHEWLGRLLSALAGAGTCAALYGLALPLLGRRGALYAGLALALMPFPLYFGRAVMPDALMLLAATLALLTFRRWLERPSAARYSVALLCGALAPLAKTPNLLIAGIPLAFLALVYRPRRWLALATYAACWSIPALLWTLHARTLPSEPWLSFGIGEKLLDMRLLADGQFYLLLMRWSVENVITLAGAPFFALGLVPLIRTYAHKKNEPQRAQRRKGRGCVAFDAIGIGDAGAPTNRELEASQSPAVPPTSTIRYVRWLPHAWLLGVVVFLLIGAAGVVGQDYYVLPLAGPAALLIGAGMERARRALGERKVGRLAPPLGLALLAAFSLARVAPLYRTADFYATLGRRVDLALPPGERAGVIAPAVSEILYYGGRRGWRLDPGVLVPGGLASLGPDLGIRYVLIGDPWLSERREVLAQALRDYRRIHVGPYALLLDTGQPGVQGEAEMVWETGHMVEEPFLSAWRAAGGVAALGYPLSDQLDGPEGRVQYFERGLLARRGAEAERAPIGRLLLAARGMAAQPAEVDARFRAVWERAQPGAPLTPALERGDGGWIQYFEYGTLEAAPGGAPELGASGRALLEARGLSEERQIEIGREE